jgi:hypothetical protein
MLGNAKSRSPNKKGRGEQVGSGAMNGGGHVFDQAATLSADALSGIWRDHIRSTSISMYSDDKNAYCKQDNRYE